MSLAHKSANILVTKLNWVNGSIYLSIISKLLNLADHKVMLQFRIVIFRVIKAACNSCSFHQTHRILSNVLVFDKYSFTYRCEWKDGFQQMFPRKIGICRRYLSSINFSEINFKISLYDQSYNTGFFPTSLLRTQDVFEYVLVLLTTQIIWICFFNMRKCSLTLFCFFLN